MLFHVSFKISLLIFFDQFFYLAGFSPIAGAFTPSKLGPTINPTIAKRAIERTPANTAVGAGVPTNEAKIIRK